MCSMKDRRRTAAALAITGLLAGGVRTAEAAPPAHAASPAAAAPAGGGDIPIVDGGRAAGQTTVENARRDGLTVVDLSDDWLPYIFSEAPDKPQPLRPYLVDLANGR